MEQRESCVFYKSFYEAIKGIPQEEQLKLYNAIFEYVFENNEIQEIGIAKSMFTLIKPNIDSANKRYISSVENGKKGGRPKTQLKPKNNLNKTQIKPIKNLNDNVNDNDNDNVKKIYGEYKHVRLTDKELQSLKSSYDNYPELITYLDEYIEMKGYKAKSHYLCIKKWVVDAVNKNQPKLSKTKEDFLND